MLRALKIVMALFGGVLAIEGLLDLIVPGQRAVGLGLERCIEYAPMAMAVLGATWIALGIFILSAARNPLQNISWVRLCAAMPVVLMGALVLTVVRSAATWTQIAPDVGFDVLFAVLFLVLGRATEASPPRE